MASIRSIAPTFPNQDTSASERGRVLVVDDETELTAALCEMLTKHGYVTTGYSDGNQALEALKEQEYDVILADLMMPSMDGITLLKRALEIAPQLVGIVMTGQGTVQTAVEAMKSGAFDYLLKPFKLGTVLATLSKAIEMRKLRKENIQLKEIVSIYELGQVVSFTLDIDVIFQKTADTALELFQAEEASILLPTENGRELVLVLARGEGRETLTGNRIPLNGTISGWVARHLEPLILQGGFSDPRFASTHPTPEDITAISMPMVLGSNLIGVINVNRRRRQAQLTEGQIKELEILVNIATSALENARLYSAVQKELEARRQRERELEVTLRRLTALRTIDLAISSSLDLRITLSILLDQVSTQLSIDAAAVLLAASSAQVLEYASGRGFQTKLIERSKTLQGEDFTSTVAFDRKTVILSDFAKEAPDPAIQELIDAEGFLDCVGTPLVAKGEVKGVLVVFHRTPFSPSTEWLDYFEALAGQAAIAIDSAQLFESLQRSNQQLAHAYNATIEGWSRALDLRDKETEGHTQRVTDLTLKLARSIGVFDEEELLQIRRGALLHDIGKMGVPDGILLKPGKLNEEERDVMKKHPEYAHQLIYPIAYLRKALDIPLYHHERWDGSGYPLGIREEQIPLPARIFSVIDVWDALRSDRPYRSSWPKERAIEYIQQASGEHFDPQIVEAFLKLVEEEEIE